MSKKAEHIGVSNDDGGNGKTTTITTLSSGFTKKRTTDSTKEGQRVLVIDTCASANATSTLVGHKDSSPNLYDLLKDNKREKLHVKDVIVKSSIPGVDVIPGSKQLKSGDLEFMRFVNSQYLLRNRLPEIESLNTYDVVLYDTPPNASLAKITVLFCVDKLIVPVIPSDYSLEGLIDLMEDLQLIREMRKEPIDVKFLLCQTDHTRMTKLVRKDLQETFVNYTFKTEIPFNTTVREAVRMKQTIIDYAPKSAGAIAYKQLVDEILLPPEEFQKQYGELFEGV